MELFHVGRGFLKFVYLEFVVFGRLVIRRFWSDTLGQGPKGGAHTVIILFLKVGKFFWGLKLVFVCERQNITTHLLCSGAGKWAWPRVNSFSLSRTPTPI